MGFVTTFLTTKSRTPAICRLETYPLFSPVRPVFDMSFKRFVYFILGRCLAAGAGGTTATPGGVALGDEVIKALRREEGRAARRGNGETARRRRESRSIGIIMLVDRKKRVATSRRGGKGGHHEGGGR